MTFLERKWRNEFSLKVIHSNLNSTEAPIGDQVPEQRLLEYGRQMAEFAQANEQEAGLAYSL
jgi:hypothetical protein